MPMFYLQYEPRSSQAKILSRYASPTKVYLLMFMIPFRPLTENTGGGLLNPHITSPSDLFSFSHLRNATRLEDARLGALRRASSRAQGLRATVDEQLFAINRDSRKAAGSEAPDRSGPHPHIGIGLPMSNIYATFVRWS